VRIDLSRLSSTAFDVTYGYDKNGNLNGVTRRNQSGSFGGAPFLISIAHNSNRLTDFEDGADIYYDDYYPFGLVMSECSSNVGNADDLYKFSGHERDDEAGLIVTFI